MGKECLTPIFPALTVHARVSAIIFTFYELPLFGVMPDTALAVLGISGFVDGMPMKLKKTEQRCFFLAFAINVA
jgi:hypothetical protein